MLLKGALLWMLALGPSSLWAQATIREDDQPNIAAEGGSDDQSGEKSKNEEGPPTYQLLRYDEDYSYLKEPSRRTDFWDAIKYVPVSHREDWYMSFGGFLRERFELLHNGDAGAAP